ncbi:MAG: deoxyribonuclease IV [Nitrospirota bacterium]
MSGKLKTNTARVGVHTSIAGGISKAAERAASLHCLTMQIFSHSPRQWQKSFISPDEAERFRLLRQKYDISPVFVHVSYLINLASLSNDILRKSIDLLSYELENADAIGAEYVVLHTGSAAGQDEQMARAAAAKALLKAAGSRQYRASVLLENTAGEKGDITSSVAALSEIMNLCDSDRIGGICIDTCHAFSSGYDLRSVEGVEKLLGEIEKHVGLDKLKLIHLNDSKRPLGSGVDRHEHIGKGYIGNEGFRNLLGDERISNVPLILETPKKDEDDDRRNLKVVFGILRDYGRTDIPRS